MYIVYVNRCLSVKYCCVRIGGSRDKGRKRFLRQEILYTSIGPVVTVHALWSIISRIVYDFHWKGKVFFYKKVMNINFEITANIFDTFLK